MRRHIVFEARELTMNRHGKILKKKVENSHADRSFSYGLDTFSPWRTCAGDVSTVGGVTTNTPTSWRALISEGR
jgi:hypothetical protein